MPIYNLWAGKNINCIRIFKILGYGLIVFARPERTVFFILCLI